MGVRCQCLAMMLPTFLLWLSISFCFSNAENAEKAENAENTESRLEDLVERLELRLKDVEERVLVEKEKVAELENEMNTMRKKVEEECVTKESVTNLTTNGLTNPSVRDLPIVFISVWQPNILIDAQTVPFESFLANFNNADTPGGGDGLFDLDSGTFTCLTPGYYEVSFSAQTRLYTEFQKNKLYLYKNGVQLPESYWHFESASNDNLVVTGTRILIIHMDNGETLDLRTNGWRIEN